LFLTCMCVYVCDQPCVTDREIDSFWGVNVWFDGYIHRCSQVNGTCTCHSGYLGDECDACTNGWELNSFVSEPLGIVEKRCLPPQVTFTWLSISSNGRLFFGVSSEYIRFETD
jgi:hypothetical protein